MNAKKLPIGIQTFSKLIEQDYLYIDKTQSIHRLLTQGGHYYFLSRPRRFGKSLLVSTLKEIFSGNRELFKDLWIYDKIQWTPHPVIHLDFLNISYKTPEILEKSLGDRLVEIASENHIQLPADYDSKAKFARLIKELSSKGDVVILVDEYDKPIIDFIDQPAIAHKNRDYLKDFYSVLKGSDQYIRFAFLTGVSKFSKVSVFSDLNNLDDITLDESFPTLLGCTEDELLFYFEDRIEQLANKTNEPASGNKRTLREIREWYNGYSWDGAHFIYNPLSLLNLFSRLEYDNYWFTTGTPAFLIKILKERGINIREFESVEVDSSSFETYDIENIGSVSLLFQTGYLTVKKKTIGTGGGETLYQLSSPNKEVRDSFLRHFLDSYTPREARENASQLR